jgi:methionyl-tRNA synthetase
MPGGCDNNASGPCQSGSWRWARPRTLAPVPDRFYVTTPIYYVNDVPHVGHAYTTVIADALARWHRLLGDETRLLTGTDEHGLKVARAATAQGRSPQEHADVTSQRFRETWDLLDIGYDDYIRTTEPRHHTAVQALLGRIHDNGWIYQSTYAGHYCVACEAYYAADDLVDGGCPVHGDTIEWLEEDNWFFKLSAFTQPLLDWYESHPGAVTPTGKRNEALGVIRGGLEDISITRSSIDWGVPVPWDPDHVFYVWYDALINYVTAIGYGTDDELFETWWPVVHHLIGKDILRFHCVYWPAMLLAAGIEPPHRIAVHGYLLVGGEKMSKTSFNQIYPADLVEGSDEHGFAAFGSDGFRYQFLRDNPFGPDGDFSYESMVARYNADLANNLGNLTSRVATVVAKKCGGIGPAPRADSPLAAVAADVLAETTRQWADIAPSRALEATWRLIHEANAHLEDNEPWKMDPGPDVDAVLGDALEALRIVAVLASPATPRTCAEIWRRIGLSGSPEEQRLPEAAAWGAYPGGLPVEKGAPLFPRMTA